MAFEVSGGAYDRFMGRFSGELAPGFVDFAGIATDSTVLDVGCGPGALTGRLVGLVGSHRVAAVDPSEPFVDACSARFPGVDVRRASAASLPWPDHAFDATLAQLVVNFLPDPVAGVADMRRVVRPGGVVAACTWDYADGMRMLRLFWDAARALDQSAADEGNMPYTTAGELVGLWDEVGLTEVESAALEVTGAYAGFDDWWASLGLGVGPAGSYVASLAPGDAAALRAELFDRVGSPKASFTLPARAWAVRGRA